MEMRKISCRRPRSAEGTELGHFTLLSRTGRQRNVQKVTTQLHSYFCSLYNPDGPLFGDPQNVLRNENHEKFQHFRSQRKKLLLTSGFIVKGKISGGVKGFSSLIKFVKVSFISFVRIEFRQSISAFVSFLSLWFSYFVEFAPAKLALLAHPNRDYSKFLNYRTVRLKIKLDW